MPTSTTLLDDNWLNLAELYEQIVSEHAKLFEAIGPLKDEIRTSLAAHFEAEIAKTKEELAKGNDALGAGLIGTAANARVELESRLEQKWKDFDKALRDQLATSIESIEQSFSLKVEGIAAGARSLELSIKKEATELEARREATMLAVAKGAAESARLSTRFKGNFDKGVTYHRDDWFTFRGSSYLVLAESITGTLPTAKIQRGPDAVYAVLAASGAPGLPPIIATTLSQLGIQKGTTALVVNQQSYAITFPSAYGTVPTWVTANVQMPNSSGEVFDAAVDVSTLTTTGCTFWLSGVPTSASTGGKLNWRAEV
jgi:hypothetical protein